MFLAESYLKKRFEEGKKEGKVEMWQAYMREWKRQRDEAEEQGLEFTEPPPPKPE